MDSPRSECRANIESTRLEPHLPDLNEHASSDASAKADDERAAANVAEWRKYLPQDCIDSMVKACWDRTV